MLLLLYSELPRCKIERHESPRFKINFISFIKYLWKPNIISNGAPPRQNVLGAKIRYFQSPNTLTYSESNYENNEKLVVMNAWVDSTHVHDIELLQRF